MTAVEHGPVTSTDRIGLLVGHRRQILALLGEERTAGELAREMPTVTRTTVSQHLTVLLEAGLITCRRDDGDGRRRVYRADRWALRVLFLETWEELIS